VEPVLAIRTKRKKETERDEKLTVRTDFVHRVQTNNFVGHQSRNVSRASASPDEWTQKDLKSKLKKIVVTYLRVCSPAKSSRRSARDVSWRSSRAHLCRPPTDGQNPDRPRNEGRYVRFTVVTVTRGGGAQ